MNLIANRPVVNLLAEPYAAADIVSQALFGAPSQALEERDGWVYHRGEDGYCGWSAGSDFLRREGTDPEGERARISVLYANLRHRPCSRSGPVACVSFSVTLPVAEREPGWAGLRLPDDSLGWVEEKRTEPDLPCPARADALLETARLFLGVPYLWGGTSGFGIDCSGFAQAVFRRHGITLPRDAHQQAELGGEIAREEVRAGDLLYFAPSPDAPRRRITHVGIAVDSGSMMHALGGESVVETPIDGVESFWGARRVL